MTYALSALAAVTNYHRLSDLHSKHLFLTVLKSGSQKSGCLTWWYCGEGPVPYLQMRVLCPHIARTEQEGTKDLLCLFLCAH